MDRLNGRVALLGPLVLASQVATASPPPAAPFPTNEDLRHVRAIAEPRLSPDGRLVLLRVTEATADGGLSHIWLTDVAGGPARQLTYTREGDKRGEHDGRWSADGASVFFLAKRGERTELFQLPLAGGEAHVLTLEIPPTVDASKAADALPPAKPEDAPAPPTPKSLPLDITSFEPSPDGHVVAVIAADPQTPGEKAQETAKADAVLVDHDPHGKRLYLYDTAAATLAAAAVPPDVQGVAWSPVGDRLIATTEAPNNAGDLAPANAAWLVDAKDPAHPTRLSEAPATIEAGAWSEDGERYGFLAQAKVDAPPGYGDLYALSLADHTVGDLSDGFAGSLLGEPPLSLGGALVAAVQDGFVRGYARLDNDRTAPIDLGAPVVGQLTTNARRTGMAWIGSGSGRTPTLFYAPALGEAGKPLQTPAILAKPWAMAASHPIHWKDRGLEIQGLIYLPTLAAGQKAPLIVDVHGGPTGAWSDGFDPLADFLVGQGWAVLRPNPRGSTGRGAAFAAANHNDLGGADLEDVMTGVDAAIAAYPIDPAKLALLGYSYGGEMAGFAEGRTDRFKAIVSGAPVIDQESEYGTEHNSRYDRWFYGRPWDHPQDAWRQSPLARAGHAKTPLLLIQGEADKTDPLGQSQEMYRALRQVGVPVEMVQYPREDHGPLSQGISGAPSAEPWHGFDARRRIVTFIADAFAGAPLPRTTP